MSRAPAPPGDEAQVCVTVGVPREEAFRAFTEDIDRWWRRGMRYRIGGPGRSVVHLEAGVGGRLWESFDGPGGPQIFATGQVTAWEPPGRLVLEWRAVNFAPAEKTEVEVLFDARGARTMVTVIHRGWSHLRLDHPVRHGQPPAAFVATMGRWWGDLMTSLREHLTPAPPPAGG